MLRSILVSSCLAIASTCLTINFVQAEESTIISHLMLREATIVISQNSQGEIEYSLQDSSGQSLATKISEAQLVAQYPEIYRLVRPAVADTETSPWAGLLDY